MAWSLVAAFLTFSSGMTWPLVGGLASPLIGNGLASRCQPGSTASPSHREWPGLAFSSGMAWPRLSHPGMAWPLIAGSLDGLPHLLIGNGLASPSRREWPGLTSLISGTSWPLVGSLDGLPHLLIGNGLASRRQP